VQLPLIFTVHYMFGPLLVVSRHLLWSENRCWGEGMCCYVVLLFIIASKCSRLCDAILPLLCTCLVRVFCSFVGLSSVLYVVVLSV
jgi:hypothetical protein